MLTSRQLLGLGVLGLALRAPGLLFNGNADMMTNTLDWGADVVALGLVKGFGINYGILSYAFFGACAAIAEWMPRFWWIPEKVLTIAFEAGVFWALLRLVPPTRARLIALAYWLNPWFIWHGAYHGFWEGPHVFFALCGVLVLTRRQDWRAWAVVGVLLFCSGQIKPQGIVHFAAPLGLYLAVDALRGRWRPLAWYSAGFTSAAIVTSVLLWAGGASPLVLVDNFRSALISMPWLSNGAPGIWRFVSYVAMQWQGLEGEVVLWRVSIPWLLAVSAGTGLILLAMFLTFSRRLSGTAPASAWSVYLVLVFGALVVSQFGLRSHVNHLQPFIVLLIPVIVGHRHLQWAWGAMFGLVALAHVARYGLGSVAFIPNDEVLARFGHADRLANAIKASPAFTTPDALLRFQAAANEWFFGLASHEALSVLSLVMFAAACVLTHGLYDLARTRSFR